MTLNILGTEYTIEEKSLEEDSVLNDADGYTDWTTKKIVVRRELEGTLENMDVYVKKVKRHEIVHAFMEESGLAECSCNGAWARNEEVVDWIARQGPKIYKAWQEADCL